MADKENTKASGSSSASASGGGGGSSSGSIAKAGSSGGKIGRSSSGSGGSLSKGGSGKSSPSFGKVYSSTGGNKVSQKVSSKSSGATRNYAKSTAGGGAGSTASPGTRASLGGAKFAPSWVGKNPYQWGNTTAGIQDYGDRDPERQAKIDSLGYAADDPDRSFHYYNPDPSSSKGYLDRANSISTDRNFFQANNFWNTIDGPYESEDARKSDAAQWMTDAQIYGKWAEDHGLSYTDDDGNTVNMADVWKDIWNYANEITGGVGDSESTVAGRDIEAYLTGGKYDSATTQQMLDKAKYFADNAESEKEASLWADYEKSLKIQLEADQKQEKKDNSFLGKAEKAAGNLWDSFKGLFSGDKDEEADLQMQYNNAFQRYDLSGDPEDKARMDALAEQLRAGGYRVPGEETENGSGVLGNFFDRPDFIKPGSEEDLANKAAAQEAAKNASGNNSLPDQMAAQKAEAWDQRDSLLKDVSDAVNAYYNAQDTASADAAREQMNDLASQVIDLNKALGYDAYEGLPKNFEFGDVYDRVAKGRAGTILGGIGSALAGVHSLTNATQEEAELRDRENKAFQRYDLSGDEKDREAWEAAKAELDQYLEEHPNDLSTTGVGNVADYLLDVAKANQDEAEQSWANVTYDLSGFEEMLANAGLTFGDVIMDVGGNRILNGLGTFMMYTSAAGSEALAQMDKENSSPDAIALAGFKGALSAYLSTRMLGGISEYGESLIGDEVKEMISRASPEVQNTLNVLINTEGFEEGMEDILNYVGDILLELDPDASLNMGEVGMDTVIGYIVGVLTEGLSSGVEYNAEKKQNLAREAVEFYQSGMSWQEAEQIGKESTKDQAVMKYDPKTANESQNQNMATSQNAAIQGQDQNVAPAPASQTQNQNMAASQNQALEGQGQNVSPAPVNQEPQNRNLAEGQAAALAGQDQNPTPAPQRATSGPSANTEPYTGPELPGASYGGGDTIEIGVDEVPVHFAVVPLSELQASHDIYGNPNPNYPPELQPRDRTSEEYQAEARERGAKLNPRKLESYADATTGAPVIRSDGVVISGNGRTLAIDNAFLRGNGSAYTEYLRQNAGRFGIDPASIGEDSVLVRVVDGEDYDWERLAAGGNNSGVTRYNAAEAANADAKVLMSDSVRDILNLLDTTSGTDLKSDSNEAFMRAFIRQVVPDSERGSMTAWKTEPDGTKVSKITADAYNRAKNAIFTAAYGDSEISSQMALSAENGKIIDAMVFSAPKVLAVEAGVQDGTVRNFGLRDHMVNALQLYNDARNAGQSVAQMTANASLFSEYDPDTIYIARLIEEQRTAPRKMQAFFDGLCDKITKIGAPDSDADGFGLFGDEAPETFAFRDVIEGGRENYAAETKDTLPSQDVWGRGSYEELADVAGLNQTQRQAYYRDESRAQRSPTDTGYAGGSEPVTAGEADARNADGNGADGGLTELASRMLDGDVSDEEYLSLMETEDGRAQLAAALGLPNSDPKTVANGLSLYLIFQDQLRQSVNQQTETRAPRYGEEGFIDPMGEDIEEDSDEDNRPPLDDLLTEMAEEEGKTPAQQNQDTAGMLLGEEAETPQNAQGNSAGVNSRAEETNSNTDVLNAQETAGSANPEQQTSQNSQNPSSKKEKISQYFLNTLTESGRAEGLDPVTYNPTSEAESLTNAAMSLAADEQAVLDRLMSSPAWNGELTDAAWMLENRFYKEFVATGDRTNWDAWRKLETYKISETAKGLQAVAKQSRPGAAGVLEASLNLLEDFKKKGSKENQAVSQQEVAKAEKDVNEVTRRMAEIENSIDQRVDSGMNETEAKAMSKEAYLDLAEKINQIRNTGKMFFGGKKKFRNMLGSQDMDFIQRFVACQAAGIAEDVNYKGKQDRLKQLNTFQKLAQLTGTGTWSRNLQGNATFGLIDLLANNGVAVAVDQIVSKATGQRSTGFELGALSKDARAAAKLALDRSILEVAANIDLAENSAMEGYDLSRTRTFDPNGNLVERVLSRWEQWNGYMLNSSDKFFRGGAARSSADAIRRANARNGYIVNDADVQQTADQVAAYRLFQNNGVAAEAADSIREGLNRLGAKAAGRTYERGQFGLGTALTPYTKVPTNIGVKALEFSPAGAAKGFAEIVRTARDAKTGKATMAQQNQAVTDFARGVTGTALIVGLAQLMKNWPFFKDWENEEDKDVKAQNKAEGKSGMQFNIDMMLRAADGDEDPTWRNSDRTIDISSIEPANQLLTAASLISEGMPKGQAILQSAKENFMDLPSVSALKNIEDTIRYTDTPDDLGQTLLNTTASTAGGVASGFIPAPIRHATTVSDEYARDTSGSNATERAVNQFKASVPGLRETLPVKTDSFGNEISAGDLTTRLLNTYGGNKYTEINQSDLSREAERLREATGEQLIPNRNGPSSEKFGDEKVKFTAQERKDWKDDYGQELDDAVSMLMRSSVYKDADDDLKAELWKNLEGYAKDEVKAEYADDHYLQYESKYDYLDEVDNPITFLTTNKAFNIAEENEDYDIVDTLIGPVGRLSQDEQELMRKKNSTLMNYYDYLTPNDRGYKVKDAETVRQFKKDAKANAEGRGKTSASGQDKFSSVYDGYRNKAFTDGDVDAIMSKSKTTEDEETGETTVTWDITKGRAAIYLAMRAGGASVQEALDAVKNADVDYDNTIDEKGVKIKAEHEGTNALKRYGSGNDAMWYEFNEIMYPWKNKR